MQQNCAYTAPVHAIHNKVKTLSISEGTAGGGGGLTKRMLRESRKRIKHGKMKIVHFYVGLQKL